MWHLKNNKVRAEQRNIVLRIPLKVLGITMTNLSDTAITPKVKTSCLLPWPKSPLGCAHNSFYLSCPHKEPTNHRRRKAAGPPFLLDCLPSLNPTKVKNTEAWVERLNILLTNEGVTENKNRTSQDRQALTTAAETHASVPKHDCKQ